MENTRKEKWKFQDVFEEDQDKLILKINVEVKGESFDKGYSFTENKELNGVNFHKYRYLDLSLLINDNDNKKLPKIVGFYPSQKDD